MIHSLMPPKVAQEIMKSRDPKQGEGDDEVPTGKKRNSSSHKGSDAPEKVKLFYNYVGKCATNLGDLFLFYLIYIYVCINVITISLLKFNLDLN